MEKEDKIFIAGHNGLVGSAIVRALTTNGYHNLITADRKALDLMDTNNVEKFFQEQKPSYVFIAAAKVGGILANDTFPADFIYQNLMIQSNIIHASKDNNVSKLLFLGSSCIYPKFATQPINENALLTGELEPTNLPYAIAKIAGKVMCDSYNKQHGLNAFTVMPSNVYGPGDNFNPNESHVVAGLMRRIHEAKCMHSESVTVWGTGRPLRELIFVDDLASACIHLMQHYNDGGMVNVGSGEEYSIKHIAKTLCDIIDFRGQLVFDHTKPDGTPRKIMDINKITKTGWAPQTSLPDGLHRMYSYFLDNKVQI